jgi:hypothetical protein
MSHSSAAAPLLVLAGLLGTASASAAETWIVRADGSGDFPTIQAAVDAAENGDVIELADGTFTGDGNRDVDFLRKALTIRSQSGEPESCTIDCEGSAAGPHRAFLLEDALGSPCAVEGITIRDGLAPEVGYGLGGAIYCFNGALRVSRCRFVENRAYAGGAIAVIAPTFSVEDCWFIGNRADDSGGALVCAGDVDFRACTLVENVAFYGGAIALFDGETRIQECTLYRDRSAIVATSTPPSYAQAQ